MDFTSNLDAVLSAYKASKGDICDGWGTYLIAEYQNRTPVVTGNMKIHETYNKLENDSGIDIGTTTEAAYAIYVEKGTSKQKAQNILENTVMDNANKLEEIMSDKISSHMGG